MYDCLKMKAKKGDKMSFFFHFLKTRFYSFLVNNKRFCLEYYHCLYIIYWKLLINFEIIIFSFVYLYLFNEEENFYLSIHLYFRLKFFFLQGIYQWNGKMMLKCLNRFLFVMFQEVFTKEKNLVKFWLTALFFICHIASQISNTIAML